MSATRGSTASFWDIIFGNSAQTKPRTLEYFGIPATYLNTPMCEMDPNGLPKVTNISVYNIWVKEVGQKDGFQPMAVNQSSSQPKATDSKAVELKVMNTKPNDNTSGSSFKMSASS